MSGEQPVPTQAARPGSRRRVGLGLAVVLGALLLIAGTAWFGRPAVPTPSPTPLAVAPTSSVPSPSPSSSPAPLPLTVAWRQAAPSAVFDGLAVGSLVHGPGGYVAMAVDRITKLPVVLTSPDGTSWLGQREPPEIFGGGLPDAIAAGPGGYAALGWEISAVRGVERVIWTSADGAVWARDPTPSAEVGAFAAPDLLSGFGHYLLFDGASPSPRLDVSADGSTWATVPPTIFGPAASVTGIVAGPTGFVAAGIDPKGAAIWTSADGHDWSRVPDLPAELATQGAPDQVVAGPTGVVVHIGGNADADTSFWSRDGRTWVALDAAGGPALPKALSGLPPFQSHQYQPLDGGIYAAPPGGYGGSGWVSADGLAWYEIQGPVFIDDLSVVVAGDGASTLVALVSDEVGVTVYTGSLVRNGVAAAPAASPLVLPVGTGPGPGADPLAAWQQVSGSPFADAASDSSMTAVAPLGSGLVAVGSRGNRPAAWVSPDGRSWRIAATQASFAPGGALTTLASDGRLLVAMGYGSSGLGPQQSLVWTSTDGLRWAIQPVSPDFVRAVVQQVRFLDGRWYAVGQRGSSNDLSSPAMWSSTDGVHWVLVADVDHAGLPDGWPLDGITSIGPQLLAWMVYGDGSVAILRSPDGRTWTRERDPAVMTPSPFAPGHVLQSLFVAGGPSGYVAVGSLYPADKLGETAAGVWTSSDGIAWTAATSDANLIGADGLVGLRWVDGRFVAFGHQTWPSPYMGGIWTSPDGQSWQRVAGTGLTGNDPRVLTGQVADLVAGPTGAVAVGYRRIGPATPAGVRTEAVAWIGGAMDAALPDVACPAGTLSVGVLSLLSAGDRWACYGGRTLTLRGYVAPPTGGCGTLGAVAPGVATLADVSFDTCGEDGDGLLAHATDQATATSISLVGAPLQHAVVPAWYVVTGHFGGPTQPCEQPLAQGLQLLPPMAAHLTCLESFAVTAMTPVKGP